MFPSPQHIANDKRILAVLRTLGGILRAEDVIQTRRGQADTENAKAHSTSGKVIVAAGARGREHNVEIARVGHKIPNGRARAFWHSHRAPGLPALPRCKPARSDHAARRAWSRADPDRAAVPQTRSAATMKRDAFASSSSRCSGASRRIRATSSIM